MRTRAEIRAAVDHLNEIDAERHYMLDISNGQCRVAYRKQDIVHWFLGISDWLSPRLPTGQLYSWLVAYKKGLIRGKELAK